MIAKDQIFIVDDDEVMCFVHESLAQNSNYFNTVRSYTQSQQALQTLEQLAIKQEILPGYLLLDLNMPVMDGWQFLIALQQLSKQYEVLGSIKVAVVTTSNLQEDKARARAFPQVAGFYSKPLPQEAFDAIVTP